MTKLDQNNIRGTLTAPFGTGSYGYIPPTPVQMPYLMAVNYAEFRGTANFENA